MEHNIFEHGQAQILHSGTTENLLPCSLDPLPRYLSSVQASEGGGDLVRCLLDLNISSGENDLYVCRVALVRVDATMGTVRAATRFLDTMKL
jgi:hypothetical protein